MSLEACESGLIERLAKPCPKGLVGSNPTASALRWSRIAANYTGLENLREKSLREFESHLHRHIWRLITHFPYIFVIPSCLKYNPCVSKEVSILVVDDEPIVCRNMKDFINNRGYHCRTASSEGEAMRMINNGYLPESALIDILIPEGRIGRNIDNDLHGLTGGLRLAKFIQKEVGKECRIIVYSALLRYREPAQEAGVWGFISKPVWNFNGLIDLLGKGFLSKNEIKKQTIDLDREINTRHSIER